MDMKETPKLPSSFILASASPRRLEILQTLGIDPEILVPDTNEDCDRAAVPPELLVEGLACRKARAAGEMLMRCGRGEEDCLILAADTVVVLGDRILEKPRDAEDARQMLRALSENTHRVCTGIAVLCRGILTMDVQCTQVRFRSLTEAEIEAYVASGEPMGKAGSYAIQERGALFVEEICGDYFNVVGLPAVCVDKLLSENYGFGLASFARDADRTSK